MLYFIKRLLCAALVVVCYAEATTVLTSTDHVALVDESTYSSAQNSLPGTGWLRQAEAPHLAVNFALTGQYDPQTATVNALLQIQLSDEWKTYWRAPGEGGVAPSITWENAEQIHSITWHWPTPKRFWVQGLATQGYQGSVNFPLELTLVSGQPRAVLQATLTIPTCTTVCVLTDFAITLAIEPEKLTPDAERVFLFSQAMSQVPQPLLTARVLAATLTGKAGDILVTAERDEGWQSPVMFIHTDDDTLDEVVFQIATLQHSDKQVRARVNAKHWLALPELSGKVLNITLTDTDFAAEYVVDVANRSADTATWGYDYRLPIILLFALAGGLILNIMPCVLPVLAIKMHSIIKAQEQRAATIRKQFLAAAFGIISTFWLLAAMLGVLKISGASVGWGIQFQNPYFIGFLVVVTWVFALSLLGIFNVRLPAMLSNLAARSGDNSYHSHFFQGMLATLLATPCTAPLLGTAVAFALGASVGVIVLVFSAIGLGMALPWLLLAAFPKICRYFPKPGPWLKWVKPTFALMLFSTSIWLISLLAPYLELTSLVTGFVALFITTLLLIASLQGVQMMLRTLAVGLLVSAVVGVLLLATTQQWQTALPKDHHWQPYTNEQIGQAIAEGKVVFIDVTADWCITCKANKIGVLLQQPVYQALAGSDVVRLRADWTTPNSLVSEYLQQNQVYGVPFNKVYGPAAPEGIALPTLLTSERVINAMEQARGSTSKQ